MEARIIGQMTLVEMLFAGMAEIRINDWRSYEPGRCTNGGHYSFHSAFRKEGALVLEEMYSSAEYPTCPICGQYLRNGDEHDGYCFFDGKTPQYVEDLIKKALSSEDRAYYIEGPALTVEWRVVPKEGQPFYEGWKEI